MYLKQPLATLAVQELFNKKPERLVAITAQRVSSLTRLGIVLVLIAIQALEIALVKPLAAHVRLEHLALVDNRV